MGHIPRLLRRKVLYICLQNTPLLAAGFFIQVGILFGAVTWPHEQDIAPETLIEDMVPVKTMPDNALHTDTSH